MDCLILPLQDRLEDWKKITGQLDKDHSKEFKKLRTELKKGHFNSQNLLSHQANSLRFKKQAFRNIQIMSKSYVHLTLLFKMSFDWVQRSIREGVSKVNQMAESS